MKHVIAFLLASAAAFPAAAEVLPVIPSEPMDGPTLALDHLPAGFDAPLTEDRLLTLADLDGSTDTITDDERRMIALLGEMLSTVPVSY